MRKGLLISLLAVSVFFSFGCSKGQIVNISGSTSVEPLSQELAAAFMAKHPKITVNVAAGGSSAGIKAAREGASDIGASSRDLKPTETGLNKFVIAYDGIAVIINKDNPVANLSVDQVKAIYEGTITNWSELGGHNAQIVVVDRDAASGTRGAFVEMVMDNNDTIIKTAIVQDGGGGVRNTVAGNPAAIGYISIASVDNTIRALKINGIEATIANVANKTYPIFRPFIYVTKNAPEGAVKQFIDFVLSAEGQKIVEASGLVPVK